MKFIITVFFICLACAHNSSYAQYQQTVIQIKYPPWGKIFADEDEFGYTEPEFEKYDMKFERGFGIRAITMPYYISAQRNITNLNTEIPDAKVETLAIGFSGILYDPHEVEVGNYLIGALGIGAGRFEFKNPDLNDWEAMIEGNAEVGFRIAEHLLIGTGIDYQHFGEPSETKAHSWTFYISTGVIF